ncbi:MAG: hypothetical protein E6K93_06530, partial [Thaumarchaeota archaeon]
MEEPPKTECKQYQVTERYSSLLCKGCSHGDHMARVVVQILLDEKTIKSDDSGQDTKNRLVHIS